MNAERLNCLYSTNMYRRMNLTNPDRNLWQSLQSFGESTKAYSGDTIVHLVKRGFLKFCKGKRQVVITRKGFEKLKEYRQIFQI